MSNDAIVHVIDDDPGVRDSLCFLLASEGLAVRAYDSADAFLQKTTSTPSGCVVSDIRMPGIDGIALLRRIKTNGWCVPVVIMTGHADVPLAVEAMKQGAVDFVEKPFDDERLLSTVRGALERSVSAARQEAETGEIRTRLGTLSERERQVLEGLIAGKANKVIAYDLEISHRTVEIYRANLMTKMKAGSLSELVRMALVCDVAPR
ncbi:response regulator FixJ [Salinarimonas ramus]|uniref:DNA-binding response regulator n=1 Tax=Salinarimonas ramus TaxID=690164 RepID=A0A917QIY6_9HYPH|nr:response regulator FixJ [Salinarimonas ramus]GGK51292.1 DNA-binding response regulator [Salinarimonas ramus]